MRYTQFLFLNTEPLHDIFVIHFWASLGGEYVGGSHIPYHEECGGVVGAQSLVSWYCQHHTQTSVRSHVVPGPDMSTNKLSLPAKISRATSPFSFSRKWRGKHNFILTQFQLTFGISFLILLFLVISPPEKSLGKNCRSSVRFQMSSSVRAPRYPLVHVDPSPA